MEFKEQSHEAKNETSFQVGQKVIWKPEVSELPGFHKESKKIDDYDAALIPLMGRHMPAKILKIEGTNVFLDIPGYRHIACNSESLELAE